jgi:hypothetical protein
MKNLNNLFALLVVSLFLWSCAGDAKTENGAADSPKAGADTTVTDTVAPPPAKIIYKDSIYDQMARFIAGLPQTENSPFKQYEQEEFWQKHQTSFDKNWKKIEDVRLAKMRKWRKEELAKSYDKDLTMFYPFSGPDFLHAHVFYPDAKRYTLFALEKIADMPDMAAMNKDEVEQSIRGVEYALRDIYSKSYFITMHMGSDLNYQKINGVVPVFLVFLTRTGHEILTVNKVALDTSGNLNEVEKFGSNDIKALRITFRETDSPVIKELVYFNFNIKNDNMAKRPEFGNYIRSLGKANTFVKSASYVMHMNSFSTMRELVKEVSSTIFQDDTGIKYKHFEQDQWKIQLYGEYTWPIKDFAKYTHQPDLKKIYEGMPADSIKHLPFFLGYHIVGDKKQNHQMAVKK